MSDWNPLNWAKKAYDVTGLDSAAGFVGNVATGDFGKAGGQLSRGGKSVWQALPYDNLWRSNKNARDLLAGRKTFSEFLPTYLGESAGALFDVASLLPGVKPATITARLAATPAKQIFKSMGKNILGSAYLQGVLEPFDKPKASAAPTQSTSSGGYGSSAAEFRRKEQEDMRRWEQQQKEKAGQTGVIPPMGEPTTGASGVAGAAPGGLVGLTPDQTYQIAMQDRLLQKQYDELLNQLALQEKQATLDTATSRYGIQREAATSGQDLATQLAAAGMDFSPASAIGAEQLVQGNRVQQEAAASKNLADILSQIKQAKVKAKGDMDLGKLLNQIDRGRQQVSNTIANVGGYYNRIGGQ